MSWAAVATKAPAQGAQELGWFFGDVSSEVGRKGLRHTQTCY